MGITVVVGLAGGGKTGYGIDIVERSLINGLKWHQIGYSSFSRAACLTAVTRAAKLTSEDPDRMQRNGFYRTLHSCALRLLGIDPKCILDHETVEGKKFLTECLGGVRGGERGTLGDKINEAMSWWDASRARLSRLVDDSERQYTAEDRHRLRSQTDGQTDGHMKDTCRTHAARVSVTDFPNVLIGDVNGVPDVIPIYGDRNFSNNQFYSNRLKSQPENICPSVFNVELPIKTGPIYKTDRRNESVSHLSMCPPKLPSGDMLEMVQKYERAKKLHGRLDFTDILMSYAGVRVDDGLTFSRCYPNGAVPAEIDVWVFDEAQDFSRLQGLVAERLSEAAGETFYLGDRYQSVYGFAGSDAAVFAALEDQAIAEGNRVLLNRSWRNPEDVLTWGEAILSEDTQYVSRNPISEAGDGSAGLLDLQEFWKILPRLAQCDVMIMSRTWFWLAGVKRVLDDCCIPWVSAQEKTSSRWQCPAKIAYTLVMRDLMVGELISEQDWRRVTETLPAKWEGKELFIRGTKAKWKKMECNRDPVKGLEQLLEWGATEQFVEFVRDGKWRVDMPLLLDTAITKYGIDAVRRPSVQLGSVHSFKGGEARNVFCLSSSTGRVDAECDESEERCLKYVSVTRASKHYRLVVDRLDVARGRPLFWAAPRGCQDWKGFDDYTKVSEAKHGTHGGIQDDWENEGSEAEGVDTAEVNRRLGRAAGLDVDHQDSRRTFHEERQSRFDSERDGTLRRNGDEDAGERTVGDPEVSEGEDLTEWWDL